MRPSAVLFGAVCVLGTTAAVALTVQEARYVAPVEVRVVSTVRTGLVTTVTVEARNTTPRARCVSLGVAARDREGHDLDVADGGLVRLGPAERQRVVVRLALTERQQTEQVQRHDAYAKPC